MATMKQVAERAGVSTSTVSHVINNTRTVSADVRQRVLAVIDEMRYIPSAIARSLKNDRTRTIGIVVPDNTSPYFAGLIQGVEEAAFRLGYNLILCNAVEDPGREAAHLRTLIEKRIDGLILVAGAVHAQLTELLRNQSIPMVLADHRLAGVHADYVGPDHARAGYLATRHLLDLGHRRIACVRGPADRPGCGERAHGYARALKEAGLAPDPANIVHTAPSSEGGFVAAQKLLAREVAPTAVFATSDVLALGVLCAAAEVGVPVPQALSVVGCGDLPLAAYTRPRLTTVFYPTYRMGQAMAERLIARIDGDSGAVEHTILHGELVQRESSGAPP
jgi:LacI family transcriptional regulator